MSCKAVEVVQTRAGDQQDEGFVEDWRLIAESYRMRLGRGAMLVGHET